MKSFAFSDDDTRTGDIAREECDARLVARAASGDRAAFDVLVSRHYNRVCAVAQEWCWDPNQVSDVALDAFTKAFKAAKNFRGDSSFTTWLHRIVVNCAHSANVRSKRRSRECSFDDGIMTELEKASYDTYFDPEQEVEFRESQLGSLRRAIERMAPDKRELLTMCYIEKAPYTKIAERLGIACGTVKSRLNRARNELKTKVPPIYT